MKRRMLLFSCALALVALIALVAGGCGKKESEQAPPPQTQAPQEQPAPAAPAETTGTAADTTAHASTAAVHDCAGGCGMTNVPEDQLTLIDGKWYCAGCAKKMAAEHPHGG